MKPKSRGQQSTPTRLHSGMAALILGDHFITDLFAENDVCNHNECRLQAGERNEQITKCNDIGIVHGQERKHSRQ